MGARARGRTFYMGCDPLFRCYERDKLTSGDWYVLRPTLEQLGWSPARGDRLLRAEWEINRSWLRDNRVTLSPVDGGRPTTKRADMLTFDEFIEVLPVIARAMWGRYRHTVAHPDRPGEPVRRRATSPFWTAAGAGLCLLGERSSGSPLATLKAAQRVRAMDRAKLTGARVIIALMLAGGPGGAALSRQEAWALVHECLADPALQDGFARYADQLRKRLALAATAQEWEAAG